VQLDPVNEVHLVEHGSATTAKSPRDIPGTPDACATTGQCSLCEKGGGNRPDARDPHLQNPPDTLDT
jgi:hypothetical protein